MVKKKICSKKYLYNNLSYFISHAEKNSGIEGSQANHVIWLSVTLNTKEVSLGRSMEFNYIHWFYITWCLDIILGLCQLWFKNLHRFQLSTTHIFP